MILNCPVQNSEDWKKLVNKVGFQRAVAIWINNGNDYPQYDSEDNIIGEDDPKVEYKKLMDFLTIKGKALNVIAGKIKSAKGEDNKKLTQQAFDELVKVDDIHNFDFFADNAIATIEKGVSKALKESNITDKAFDMFDPAQLKKAVEQMTKSLSLEKLVQINSYVDSYDIVQDVLDYISEHEKSEEEDPKLEALRSKLVYLKGLISTVKGEYIFKVKDKVAEYFATYSTKVRDNERLKLQKQFKEGKMSQWEEDSNKFETEMNEWVDNELDRRKEEIHQLEIEHVKDLLTFTPRDIGRVDALIADARGTNDHLIQLAVNILDRVELDVNNDYIGVRDDFTDVFDEWIKVQPKSLITNPEKLYDKFLEKKDGKLTQKLISLYSDEFLQAREDKNKFFKDYEREKEIATTEGDEAKLKELEEKRSKYYKDYRAKYYNKDKSVKSQYMRKLDFTELDRKMYDACRRLQDKADSQFTDANKSSKFKRKLPSINKELSDRLFTDSPKELMKAFRDDNFKVKEDDTELKASNITKNEKNAKNRKVAIFYKGQIDAKDQSYDLPAILLAGYYAAKSYNAKSTVVPTMEVLQQFFESRKVGKTNFLGQPLTETEPYTEEQKQQTEDGILSRASSRLDNILRTRLFQIPEEEYSIKGYSVNKAVKAITGVAANTMLRWNYHGGMVNFVQGYSSNWIGTLSGTWFSKEDYTHAQGSYWADIRSIAEDIGSPRPKSITNQLLEKFNVNVDLDQVNKHFTDSSFKKIGYVEVAGSFYSAPEHYLMSTVTYGVLHSIKVVDKNGNYLLKDGGTTTDKEKGMTLNQAYTQNNKGRLILDSRVHNIDNKRLEGANIDETLKNVSSKIKAALAQLQGEYDRKNKSAIQSEVWGKVIMFMRNWIYRGFQARLGSWQNLSGGVDKDFEDIELGLKHYEQSGRRFKEGSYVTAVRFMAKLTKDVRDLNSLFGVVSGTNSSNSMRSVYYNMSEMEQQNIKRFLTEVTVMIGFSVMGVTAAVLAEGNPDDPEDDNLALTTLAYIAKRNQGDLMFFTGGSISDNLRILDSPTYINKTLKEIHDVTTFAFGELIEALGLDPSGDSSELDVTRDGDIKLLRKMGKLTSIYNNLIHSDIQKKHYYLAHPVK